MLPELTTAEIENGNLVLEPLTLISLSQLRTCDLTCGCRELDFTLSRRRS
jgi:hypothetical protein